MPKLTGLEFLKALTNPPKIIITTAFREHAADSYELDVLDYLVKPIPFERFMKAVGKMIQPKPSQLVARAKGELEEDIPFIFVKEDRKLVRIYLHEIIYLESQRDYVQIATIAKQIKTRHTLQYFEELLPKKQFVRIHRSFIIAVAKIQSVSENRVEAGGKELMIGGNYKKAIFDKLNIR
jgi:DNA-binding LytR/AlgR family response regulator